jgi:hypothetical protein
VMVSVYLFRDLLIISFVLIIKFLSKACYRAVYSSYFSFICIFCRALVSLLSAEFILFPFCAAESYVEVIVDIFSDWSTFLSVGSFGKAFVCGGKDYMV